MADQKISELTELLSPAAADLLAIVDDPSGTPTTKKITVGNLLDGTILDSDISEAEGFVRKTGAGAYEAVKSNLSASAAPTVNEDSGDGYAVGSIWIDTTADKAYVLLDATVGAAVWIEITQASGTGDVVGPGSSTDNAIARFDGTGGKTLQDSGVTVDDSGNLDLAGSELRDFSEQDVTANTGASYDIDWGAATYFELTLTDSPTFTFSNLAARKAITLVLIQDGTGSRTVTWPASVDWPGGTAPTLTTTAGAVDVITLFVRSDGTTVLGFTAGLDMQ